MPSDAHAARLHDAEVLALGRSHGAREPRVHGPGVRAGALRSVAHASPRSRTSSISRALFRQRAGTLSGGQRQRLALAAATLHEPELLLLDEPTSAVDPQSRRDFWESLFALVTRGVTILVSTHYMDEAERCHELAILANGKVVAQGEPQRLMTDIPASVVEVEAADTAGRPSCIARGSRRPQRCAAGYATARAARPDAAEPARARVPATARRCRARPGVARAREPGRRVRRRDGLRSRQRQPGGALKPCCCECSRSRPRKCGNSPAIA